MTDNVTTTHPAFVLTRDILEAIDIGARDARWIVANFPGGMPVEGNMKVVNALHGLRIDCAYLSRFLLTEDALAAFRRATAASWSEYHDIVFQAERDHRSVLNAQRRKICGGWFEITMSLNACQDRTTKAWLRREFHDLEVLRGMLENQANILAYFRVPPPDEVVVRPDCDVA